MASKRTEGRRLFAEWFTAQTDVSRAQVGRALGVSATTVTNYMTGLYVPEPELRPAIRVLSGVPEAAWETSETIRRARAAMAGAEKLAAQLQKTG